ncbi:MAG: trimethylamine methyltransferase family protein [Pseudomonadota bacterium]
MAKRGGREGRLKLRATEGVFDPAPVGGIGGRYRPLSEADCQAIYDAALQILDEIGMGDVPPQLAEQCLAHGARMQADRLLFSPEMVDRIVAGAAKEIRLPARDPARSITVGGDRVYFGTGGAAVQMLDLDTGAYRAATLKDLYDATRLIDGLDNISWITRPLVATDVPDNFDLDMNTAYALLRGTTKPTAMSFFIGEHVAPVCEMMEMAGGFAADPWMFSHISPVISPLKFGEDAVDVTLACMERRIAVNCIIAAQSGATGPAPLAGFLAASLAETLAALVMVNVFEPGYPMIFSNWPFVIDLRTGGFSGSGGETAVMNAAQAQLSNWLGLPGGVAACMSDAKVPDAQMGLENGITGLSAALSGANMIFESAGMMASLLGASHEAFVIGNEMHALIQRVLRGIEVNEETLGVDAIRAAVFGDGHFLGGPQTLASMERDYFYPKLSDRDAPAVWEEGGARTMWDRARDEARERLAQPDPGYLDAAADAAIRARFKVDLPPA